jgi:uncharacterized protein (DUF1697 family)
MERLRELFTELGFGGVETFIASGNVIFETERPEDRDRELEADIEGCLRTGLGYEVDTFVRSLPALHRIAAYEPFPRAELELPTNDLYITFLREPPPLESVSAALTLRSDVDDLHVDGAELFWLRRRAAGDSVVYTPGLEKLLGGSITTRNMKTVRRLVAKYR